MAQILEYLFSYSTYNLPFQQPLLTHHGLWTHREGIWVTLTDPEVPHRQGRGEIAPLPWFGSETLQQAIALCQSLPTTLRLDHIRSIPDDYPACQFGLESAWEQLQPQPTYEPTGNLPYCALLPTGESALQSWKSLWQQGYRTFKWKIGVESAAPERDRCQRLLDQLPPTCQLRLDANGGLTPQEAQDWLQFCDRQRQYPEQHAQIEFLEQPLAPSQFQTLQALSQDYTTPLALDESVASLRQLRQCYEAGWAGFFVIKPAIAGSPQALRTFCQQHSLDLVFSTVFETEIGRRASLRLAHEVCQTRRALGYGVDHWLRGMTPP